MRHSVSWLCLLALSSGAAGQDWKLPLDPASPVHPRKFGLADHRVESIRGWYLWQRWDPMTWEAEVTKDPPGEVYKVRVLPWATTYRHLVYGARPDDLLPGERVNLFFAADDRHPRGYLVHFQDELCQMKGHGHVWEVRTAAADGTTFTARVMAGGKPLDDRELDFRVSPACKNWRAGGKSPKTGDSVYLTWCWRDGQRIVFVLADDASLDAVKKAQQERVDRQVAQEGISGQIEGVAGTTVRFMAFATGWAQAGRLSPGQKMLLTRTGPGWRPKGDTFEAKLISRQNRGSYGSGVTDMILESTTAESARALTAWKSEPVVRLMAASTASAVRPDEHRRRLEGATAELTRRLAALPTPSANRADAEIFVRGLKAALRYGDDWSAADVKLLEKAVAWGKERCDALEAGRHSWAERRGRTVRGFVSAIDDSVQPYGIIVPSSYDAKRPMRLDVVLHGSSRPVGMSLLRFMSRFDASDAAPPQADFIELHPLGRVENGYRWAGETDVFEAIEAVCRNYAVDRDRVVLRGMSMGASGTWHLGLKHPDRFCALGPYCGYVDTHRFSLTPLPNFIPVGPLPPHQERMLHLLDSMDYAANAGVVPVVACMGDKDIFFDAHVLMNKAMAREGLKLTNLISPGTGHVLDPMTHQEQMRRIAAFTKDGLDHTAVRVRFVTWSLKYSRCHWLQVLGLEEHYRRAELEAELGADGSVDMKEPKNVTRFALLRPALATERSTLRIGGQVVDLAARGSSHAVVIVRREGGWRYLGDLETTPLPGKCPGLQGPIDDAFTAPFLCVRGTAKPWNPSVAEWADANLKRFAHEWSRYFWGELPVKDDRDVTERDLARCNLILFGDPGNNTLIARLLPNVPLGWTPQTLKVGTRSYAAATHAPALIYPNPLPGAAGRYVVFNSGHTFHEKELASLNYLLFPRLGDWAVFDLGVSRLPNEDEAVAGGFFDEEWRLRD